MSIQIVETILELNPLLVGKNVEATCKVESSSEIEAVKVLDPQDQVLVMKTLRWIRN